MPKAFYISYMFRKELLLLYLLSLSMPNAFYKISFDYLLQNYNVLSNKIVLS